MGCLFFNWGGDIGAWCRSVVKKEVMDSILFEFSLRALGTVFPSTVLSLALVQYFEGGGERLFGASTLLFILWSLIFLPCDESGSSLQKLRLCSERTPLVVDSAGVVKGVLIGTISDRYVVLESFETNRIAMTDMKSGVKIRPSIGKCEIISG